MIQPQKSHNILQIAREKLKYRKLNIRSFLKALNKKIFYNNEEYGRTT